MHIVLHTICVATLNRLHHQLFISRSLVEVMFISLTHLLENKPHKNISGMRSHTQAAQMC